MTPAASMLRRWRSSPLSFVRDVFGAEPDEWQRDALEDVRLSKKTAMVACKGPGKSCLLAWVIWWFLASHVDAEVMACSITEDNLKDNLWKELAIWQSKSEWLGRAFTHNSERIVSTERPKTWWASARAFPQQADATRQANTLAGFHGAHIMIVLDELGDYPMGVLSAAEAIFANEGDIHLVVAGNPTKINGPLHHIVTKDAERWATTHINGDPDDPKRSPRIDAKWAQEEIDKWGRDNPWVMVNILGQFPPAGSDQLIDVNLVIEAMRRDVPFLTYMSEARVWGLDPARFGDDESVLAKRQGVLARRQAMWRNKDGTELGDIIGAMLLEADRGGELPDALFVDVGGVGSSAYDRLGALGWGDIVIPVDFGSAPSDKRFLNKRCEIWWEMRDWLKTLPACLPNDPTLQGELTAPSYRYTDSGKQTRFKLESKEDMKKRGVSSPNRADALALTFSGPVVPTSRAHREAQLDGASRHRAKTDYNPLGGV